MSENLHRRHLTTSQRGLIAAQTRTFNSGKPTGRPALTSRNPALSTEDAAKLLQVSPALVRQAAKIEREAPELVEPIKLGKLTIGAALKRGRGPSGGWGEMMAARKATVGLANGGQPYQATAVSNTQ